MSFFITRTLQINPCPNTVSSTHLFFNPDHHDAILVSLLHAFPDTRKIEYKFHAYVQATPFLN